MKNAKTCCGHYPYLHHVSKKNEISRETVPLNLFYTRGLGIAVLHACDGSSTPSLFSFVFEKGKGDLTKLEFTPNGEGNVDICTKWGRAGVWLA
jgi:hypothetical protein